ncbi:hypothetical protein FEM03_11410 [Phragmitibacter flavus]|uniref:Carbohydrate kinase PfkB domain-containing protein n=2 Tax=Phragmitibacter flavus TaxID=2576071 RepID=A0A5R8KF75_9BACT|nr:hypothetical protein FEM03_11410 [Phragmitibacter flavus]
MLDRFVRGNVRRISPEAPVPVVEVVEETLNPGGAANVACNLARFTPLVSLMGRVGKDSQSADLSFLLEADGVATSTLLISDSIPTISKARIVARQQQIVRVDREKLVWLTDEEISEVSHRLGSIINELDAIIIEDYGKGFVTEALVNAVTAIAAEHKVLITVDPSPRNPLNWSGVDLVKPNRLEAFAAAGLEDHHFDVSPGENSELLEVGRILLEKWQVPQVLVTLGEQGMMLFRRDQAPHCIPTCAQEVYDVSGAGDTAIAILTLALAAGKSSEEAADIANQASGIVVGKLGTACVSPEELLAAYAS